jgi:hypothetical protein
MILYIQYKEKHTELKQRFVSECKVCNLFSVNLNCLGNEIHLASYTSH